MPWSTSELARLAGTTLNTIRHYHRIGLLDQPERRYNGYKEYEVTHLVSLLRIRRLVALGVPLSKVNDIQAAETNRSQVLRAVDAELREESDRLTRARREIASILRNDAPADAPVGFESVASRLSDADTAMIHLYARMYDPEAIDDIRRMTEAEAADLAAEIDNLPADADEATRQGLIDRLIPSLTQNFIDYPWLLDPASRLSTGSRGTAGIFIEAVVELYNPAQLDVFARASVLGTERATALTQAAHADELVERSAVSP